MHWKEGILTPQISNAPSWIDIRYCAVDYPFSRTKVMLLSMCLICISRSKDDTYFFNLSNKTTFFGKFLELAYEEIIGKKIEADYERKRSITKIIIFVNARPNISLVLYI